MCVANEYLWHGVPPVRPLHHFLTAIWLARDIDLGEDDAFLRQQTLGRMTEPA